jgi:uridine kinase
VAEIIKRKNGAKPLRVGIDGRCASGKTMLADELASALTSARPDLAVLRPSVDGFHHTRERRYRQGEYSPTGYYEDAYDYKTIAECLLEPLSGNMFPVSCKQVSHDWRTDLRDDAPAVSVTADTILLFEGLFLFRREINSYWDFRILLEIDAESSIARAVQRNTGTVDSREIVEKKYRLRYEPAWQIYLDNENPAAKADLVLDNRNIPNPIIVKYATAEDIL